VTINHDFNLRHEHDIDKPSFLNIILTIIGKITLKTLNIDKHHCGNGYAYMLKMCYHKRTESCSGDVYSIQQYMIKFDDDLRLPCKWFSPSTLVSSTNKTNRHVITEILLIVAKTL